MVLKLYNTESVQEFPNCIVFIYVFPDFIIFIYIYIKRKELQDQKQKMENKKTVRQPKHVLGRERYLDTPYLKETKS